MASFWSNYLVNFINQVTGVDTSEGVVSLATESVQARAIEQGLGFNVSCYNTSFASTSIDNFLIVIPDAIYQITLDISRLGCIDTANNRVGSVRLEVFEDTTVSNVGANSNYYVMNYDRNSSNTLDVTITYAPTITDDGTEIFQTIANSAYTSATGLTAQVKPNTNYMVRVTNTGGIEEEYAMNLIMFELPAGS